MWPSGATYGSDLTFNDAGTVDDGGTVGSTAAPADISGLLATVRALVPPHATCNEIILAFNQADFDGLTPGGNWNLPWERNPDLEYINVV